MLMRRRASLQSRPVHPSVAETWSVGPSTTCVSGTSSVSTSMWLPPQTESHGDLHSAASAASVVVPAGPAQKRQRTTSRRRAAVLRFDATPTTSDPPMKPRASNWISYTNPSWNRCGVHRNRDVTGLSLAGLGDTTSEPVGRPVNELPRYAEICAPPAPKMPTRYPLLSATCGSRSISVRSEAVSGSSKAHPRKRRCATGKEVNSGDESVTRSRTQKLLRRFWPVIPSKHIRSYPPWRDISRSGVNDISADTLPPPSDVFITTTAIADPVASIRTADDASPAASPALTWNTYVLCANTANTGSSHRTHPAAPAHDTCSSHVLAYVSAVHQSDAPRACGGAHERSALSSASSSPWALVQ
mmetsp:Transcript_24699/g.58771  ORF Transcript_24699/g.58771 Transcript_24699/m.58771 type:complete len:358 (-) Transcript_24699:1493-2566(-)